MKVFEFVLITWLVKVRSNAWSRIACVGIVALLVDYLLLLVIVVVQRILTKQQTES